MNIFQIGLAFIGLIILFIVANFILLLVYIRYRYLKLFKKLDNERETLINESINCILGIIKACIKFDLNKISDLEAELKILTLKIYEHKRKESKEKRNNKK